ncbi:MAG: DUF805 domain-containing protein [Caulobacter sp.]|jgi:uncharacterized membrane protein YhaH (DUF805 family)
MMDWQALFLSPNGRIGRQNFWIGFAITFVAGMVVNSIPFLGFLLGILLIWPMIVLHAKRLHDIGHSAVLLLVPIGISVVLAVMAVIIGGGALFAASEGDMDTMDFFAGLLPAIGIMALAVLVEVAFLLWCGLTPGQPAENRFGPPPAA